MGRARVMASMLAVAVVVAGCGDIRDTLHRLARESSTSAPTPAVSSDDVVAEAQPSVVKVHGEADSCYKFLEGSGFVVAPHKVMTNAHVVAGAETFSVDAGDDSYDAQVISYDPQADISILDVPDLPAQPLKFAEYTAGAASFTVSPAKIREVTEIIGPDIYNATSVTRQVYILSASLLEAGSSGSAVVDLYGRVLGVYFGAESHNSTTGFAMTAAQVAPQMAKVGGAQAVGTGACVIG